jgi:hypothetical protein
MMEKAKAGDQVSSGLAAKTSWGESAVACGRYYAECHDKDGNLKWTAEGDNLVVNVGLQYMAGTALANSKAQITLWYVGLYGAAASNTPAASDTMAPGGHPGWTEIDCYSDANRPQAIFAASTNANPSVVTNTSNKAVFNIDATATVGGAFLTSDNTILGTTGTLFSAADFQSPGDRSVVSGDVISVTYQFSLTAT